MRGQAYFLEGDGTCRQVPLVGRGQFPNHERILEVYLQGWVWRLKPLITVPGRLRQEDYFEFEASPGFKGSSMLAGLQSETLSQ